MFKIIPSLLSSVSWVSIYIKMNFKTLPKQMSEQQRGQLTSARIHGYFLSMVAQDKNVKRGNTKNESATTASAF